MAGSGRLLLIGVVVFVGLGLPAPVAAGAGIGAAAPVTLALTAGPGGTVAADPPGPTYEAGAIVTLAATTAQGNLFVGWVIDGVSAGWATPRKLVMDADHAVAAAFAPAAAFTDFPANGAEAEAIRQISARGVIQGYTPAGCAARGLAAPCFGPADTVLRGEIAVMIVRAMGWDTVTPANAQPFVDIADMDPEIQRAIAILAERGVMQGYGGGLAGPTDPVLRIQIVSLITRAMVEAGLWQAATADNPALYPNIPATSPHRLDLITFVANAGAIPDRPQNQAWDDWLAPAPRAWTARLLWQALDATFTGGPFNPSPTNSPPVAVADSYTTAEDTPLAVATPGALANDSDPNADALAAVLVAGPSHAASFALNADGSFGYTPALDYTGPDSFTYQARDPSGATSAATTVAIDVTPVNDAPVHTVPGPQSALANTPFAFSAATGNAISVADVDAGGGALQVTLTATNGTLTLATTAGLAFTPPADGTADAAMTFTGTLAAINAALNGLSFTPDSGFTGAASLQIVSNDQGNTGTGGAQSDTDTVAIAVNAGPAATIAFESESGSTTVGQTRTIRVRVTDSTSTPVQGYTVGWAADANSGSVSAPTSTTDASGIAEITWTLGTQAGAQSASATATGLAGSPVPFSVTAVAGPASIATSTITANPAAITADGASTSTITVQLKDQFGNDLTASSGTVALTTTGGTFTGGVASITATDNLNGTYTATLTAPITVGAATITGTLDSNPLADNASVTFTAGAAAKYLVAPATATTVTAGGTVTITAQLADANDNPVAEAGRTVNWASTNGGSFPPPGSSTTDASGVATVAFTAGTVAGTVHTVTATDNAAPAITGTSGTITTLVGPASLSTSTITASPTQVTANGTDTATITVQLKDQYGNNLTTSGGVVTLASTLGTPSAVSDNNDGSYTATLASATTGTATISAELDGNDLAQTATVDFVLIPTKYLVTADASSVPAGGTVTITAQLADAGNNPVPQSGRVVTWSKTGAGGSFATATSTTDSNGVATVVFTVHTVAGTTHAVTATDNADATIAGTSGDLLVVAGPVDLATSTITASPASIPVSIAPGTSTSTVTVQLKDQHGNNLTASGGTVALSTTNGSLGPVTDNSNGSYTATLTAPALVGSATISGTLNLSPLTDTEVVTFTPGPLDQFLVEVAGGGNIGTQTINAPFTIDITAQDANNNTVTSFSGVGNTVDIATSGGILSAGGGTTAPFASGVLASHSVNYSAGGVGVTLTATRTGGGESGTSNAFTVQAPPVANDDTDPTVTGGTSAPGSTAYHIAFNGASNGAIDALANDTLGFPNAPTRTFGNVQLNGGGAVGGAVTANPFGGAAVDLGNGGSLAITAAGLINLTAPTGFTGLITFDYRLSNALGSDDATVTIAVGARPVAANDTYGPTVLGNVPINTATSSNFTVSTNDQGDARTLALGSATNGTATLNPNGTFTFTPAAGYEGPASFTYTVANGFGTSAPATVALNVNAVVWFVNAGAVTNGDGQFGTPFNCLTGPGCFDPAAADQANDRIFLYSGAYTGGLTLLANQRLIGQGASGALSATANANVTWPPDSGPEPATGGAAPTITTGAASTNGVNLGSDNTLRGFGLGNVGAGGAALSGTDFGTLTVSEVGISTNGQALSLTRTANPGNSGTLSGGFTAVGSTGGANNISLSGVGTSGTFALGTGALSGASAEAFKIVGGSGTYTYGGNITGGAGGAAISVAGGSASVTFSGTVSQASNAALLSVTGGHSGTLTFTGTVSATGVNTGTGLQFNNADGTYNLDGVAAGSQLAGGDAGVDILNGSGGSFTFGANLPITNPSGTAFFVNASTPTVAMKAAITQNAGKRGVYLQDNTGGTFTFTGTLTLNTTTQNAFEATHTSQAGTVVVQTATANVLATTTGTALRVNNVTIGAGGLTFRSISANGGANGIVLVNTGTAAANGGLTVTGNGGNCSEADQTCTGGRIQNSTGADTDPVAALPPGTGVVLRSTKAVSLTRMRLDNHQNYGIHGLNVVGFALANSVVNGVNGTNVASPFRDSSLRFDQVTGAVSITNSLLTGGFQHNLLIDTQSGTATVTVSGNTIKNTSAAVGDDGFQLEAEQTATVNAFVTNNSFSAHGGDHFNLSLVNNAVVELTFTGNAFAGGHPVGLGQGLFVLGASFNGSLRYDISNNGTDAAPLTGNKQGAMLFVNKGSGTGTFSGRITNNVIGNPAITGSGSEQAMGIHASARGAGGSHTTLIDGNKVRQYFDRGIVLEAGEGSPTLTATVTNNTVSNFADATNSLHGIHFDFGILSTDNAQITIDVRNNLIANAGNEPQGGVDFRMRTAGSNDVFIAGYTGGNNSANAQAFIDTQNPDGTTFSVSQAASGTYNNGPSTPLPPPTLPAPSAP